MKHLLSPSGFRFSSMFDVNFSLPILYQSLPALRETRQTRQYFENWINPNTEKGFFLVFLINMVTPGWESHACITIFGTLLSWVFDFIFFLFVTRSVLLNKFMRTVDIANWTQTTFSTNPCRSLDHVKKKKRMPWLNISLERIAAPLEWWAWSIGYIFYCLLNINPFKHFFVIQQIYTNASQ